MKGAQERIVHGAADRYTLVGPQPALPGSARIYEVKGRPEILYKEFAAPRCGEDAVRRVESLVAVAKRLQLESAPPPFVRRIAWPIDLVAGSRSVVGVIIPRAGKEFYRSGKLLTPVPQTLDHLRVGKDAIPVRIRLASLWQLSGVLTVLERGQLVHGDISAQNVLWSESPEPSVFLIDCDGMRHSSDRGGSTAYTPGWADPRIEHGEICRHDMKSDWFALSLAVWRVIVQVKGGPARGPGGIVMPDFVPPPIAELFKRTFADDRNTDSRPAPQEWMGALDETARNVKWCRRIDGAQGGVRRSGHAASRPVGESKRRVRQGPSRANRNPRGPKPKPSSLKPKSAKAMRRQTGQRWALTFTLSFSAALLAVFASPFLEPGPRQQAEATVSDWASSELSAETSADCPPHSSVQPPTHYRCRVETKSGAVADVWVSINVRWEARVRLRMVFYRQRAIADDIRARYRHLREFNGYGLTWISCPAPIPARPRLPFEFECESGFGNGREGSILVTLKTVRGAYSWRDPFLGIGGRASALR